MMVIGVTGSIAMGKSQATHYLGSLGFPVFDSDAEVHMLYDSPHGADLIRPLVPQAIVNGKVDRAKLSACVLADPALLSALETIIHSEIKTRREMFLDNARNSKVKAAILDIPLLFETGAEADMDKVIVVSTTAQIQRQRALSRPAMTEEKLALILARQMPDAEKRKRADAVIDASSTVEHMQKSLHKLCVEWGLIADA